MLQLLFLFYTLGMSFALCAQSVAAHILGRRDVRKPKKGQRLSIMCGYLGQVVSTGGLTQGKTPRLRICACCLSILDNFGGPPL